MLTVRTHVVVTRAPDEANRNAFLALLNALGADLGDQVRLNVVRFGKPGGDGGWAPVSGWHQSGAVREHAIAQEKARSARSAVREESAAQKVRRQEAKAAREAAKVARAKVKTAKTSGNAAWHKSAKAHAKAASARARAYKVPASDRKKAQTKQNARRFLAKHHGARAAGLKDAAKASPHSAYAKRKEDGKTPGHGRFHADELLRDTEDLFSSLTGLVSNPSADTFHITLHAQGTAPSRTITNQRLLEIHATGEGDMPKRDPTSDMTNYEARIEKRLRAFWDKMLGAR